MDMIRDYFAMGGYASFVWPAFALSAVVLVALLIVSLRNLRLSEAALAELRHVTLLSEEETHP